MTEPSNQEFDPSFYTEFRYEGTPEETIADFCSAARQLLRRLIDDLRSTNKGEFGPESDAEYKAMATGGERVMGHVDVFQEVASGGRSSPEIGRVVKNVVANVLADANAAAIARARAEAPRARESKFDQGKSGSAVEGMKEYADKIKDAGEGIAKILDNHIMEGLFDILAAILEDIAIFGAAPADNTGGNEATRQIEEKLDYIRSNVISMLDDLQSGQDDAADKIGRIDSNTIYIRSEVDSIEYKAQMLARLLGQTLVGTPWDVEIRPHTVSNPTPSVSIKDEMHGMEADIASIINILNNTLNIQTTNITNISIWIKIIIQIIVNIFPSNFYYFFDQVQGITPAPAGTKPLIDERIKKIFVCAEDTFMPQRANQRRRVDVSLAAFDLSGWVDLSELRTGDAVEIATFVTIAGRRRNLDRQRFNQAGIVPFSDFARGLQYVSGTDVRIEMRQPVSADNFASPISIGYQFVVESQ